ncbi:MAG: ABC-ATPase domain-containing protein [Thermoleophilia bacterium]
MSPWTGEKVEVEMDAANLKQKLRQLDGQGYKAYRTIAGSYRFGRFTLFVDYVQGDPFAAPSRLRARVPQADAGFEASLYNGPVRRVALEDFIARGFARAISRIVKGHRGTGKSGVVEIDSGAQEILQRTAAVVNDDFVEVRFAVGLPASGRRCLGLAAEAMLLDEVPRLVDAALFYAVLDPLAAAAHVEAAEDQEWLRGRLPDMGLVAFVADGAVLPRASGISDLPLMDSRVVRAVSPDGLRVEVTLPNHGPVTGMGIPEGVTLVVGGGYHGKSTLLHALQRGVYNHVPGDGRELVVTRADAFKIRAEDGRRVEQVDISPFISNLPFGDDTTVFSTDNGSGSTSQAANIVEALEMGCCLLLVDEDTSATNFMIRDELMQQLIAREKEPITPFIDQVRNLESELGVSTILVMGGSGDYFSVADTVIAMENYKPRDVTAQARSIAAGRDRGRAAVAGGHFGPLTARAPLAGGIDPVRGGKERISAKGLGTLVFGRQNIDLSQVEQLVDISQTRAIGDLVWYALKQGYFDGDNSLFAVLSRVFADIEAHGLDVIAIFPGCDYALPRPLEAAAMLNRLRSFSVRQLRVKD